MGKFDVLRGTYTIKERETGKDWGNFLFNDLSYILYVSHLGNPHSKYLNSDAVQVTVNVPGYSHLYVRDDATGKYWDPAGYPTIAPVQEYVCVHGQKFTTIRSVMDGILTEITYCVAPEDTYEIWQVTLKNLSGYVRKLSIFGAITFDLNGYSQPVYYSAATTSETMYLEEAHAIYNENRNPFRPHSRTNGFILTDQPVFAFDGNAEKFYGTFGTVTKPRVLEDGRDCTNSLATVRTRGGILETKAKISPGGEKTVYFLVGLTDGKSKLTASFETLSSSAPGIVASAKRDCSGYYLRTFCGDSRVDGVMNFWAEKQVRFCSLGKKAVRDNAQLGMAMLNFDVPRAREIIEECIRHQYSDGHAVLTWYPYLEKNVYSDPSMWLILAVCEYVKETGEKSFLEMTVPYLDGGEDAVWGHLKRAVSWFEMPSNRGPHTLPKIHHADWNDALNIPDEDAESVFMAMGICKVYGEMGALALYIGETKYSDFILARRKSLADTINRVAFNGEYYVRAFSKFGVVGDRDSRGAKIYLNPQAWAVLADIVPQERLGTVFDSIDAMETEEGIPLCAPAYEEYDETVGRMSGMLPGVYENGGIYNHAGCFKIMADCAAGRKEQAADTFLKILPGGKHNPSEKTTTEPYVFTNCYLKHPSVDMSVGFSWQTGTSAWGLIAWYEGILGIVRNYEGLKIRPNLSKRWKEVSARRVFRGSVLEIRYHNEGRDSIRLVVDGSEANPSGTIAFTDGKTHTIEVYC